MQHSSCYTHTQHPHLKKLLTSLGFLRLNKLYPYDTTMWLHAAAELQKKHFWWAFFRSFFLFSTSPADWKIHSLTPPPIRQLTRLWRQEIPAVCWSQSLTMWWRCVPWCLCSSSPASTPSYTRGIYTDLLRPKYSYKNMNNGVLVYYIRVALLNTVFWEEWRPNQL